MLVLRIKQSVLLAYGEPRGIQPLVQRLEAVEHRGISLANLMPYLAEPVTADILHRFP